jgi:hypothetical protein
MRGCWIDAAEIEPFQINKVSNALRGRSDVAPLLPWLRRYKETKRSAACSPCARRQSSAAQTAGPAAGVCGSP